MKIGITGTIASGKTSVSILFRRMGFSVFNADNYAKMATHASNPCFQSLLEVISLIAGIAYPYLECYLLKIAIKEND